jgi:membrane protein DedA with SNARE-associated domain
VRKIKTIKTSSSSPQLSKHNILMTAFNSAFRTRQIFYATLRAIGIVIIILESVFIGLGFREIAIYGSSNTAASGQITAAGFTSDLPSQGYYYNHYYYLGLTRASSSWFSNMLDTLTSWIKDYGYPALFAAALFETVIPIIPSELVFPLAGFTAYDRQMGVGHAIGMAASGALGSTVGAIAIYYASLKAGKAVVLRYGKHVRIGTKEIEKAEKWFEKHGELAVFLGRMAPGVRELISIPAGISKMNITKFILFTFAGSLIWSIALSLAGYYGGEAWSQVSESLSSILTTVGAIMVAGIIAFIVIKWFRGHRSERQK